MLPSSDSLPLITAVKSFTEKAPQVRITGGQSTTAECVYSLGSIALKKFQICPGVYTIKLLAVAIS
jgi:hypothetical protein